MSFECELQQLENQIVVAKARQCRRFRKTCLGVQVAIGVDVDDMGLPIFRQAKIDTAIVSAADGFKGTHGHFHQMLFQQRVKLAPNGPAVDKLGRPGLPFGLVRNDMGPVFKGLPEADF